LQTKWSRHSGGITERMRASRREISDRGDLTVERKGKGSEGRERDVGKGKDGCRMGIRMEGDRG
jgi:hypothetical protein